MLKRSCLSLILACALVSATHAADQDLLVGRLNAANERYRTEHYSQKLNEVYKQSDHTEALVADGDLLVSQILGSDFSPKKRVRLRAAQRKMFLRQEMLQGMFQSGRLLESDYYELLQETFRESFLSVGQILSDEEFETLFDFSKDEIPEAIGAVTAPSKRK